MDSADGTQTCQACQYAIFCSIHYLFSDQVCNSTTWAAGKVAPGGVYKKSTGSGNLRAHINKNHGEMYLEQVSSRRWVNKLPSQTRSHTDAAGYISPRSPHPNNFTITKLHSALVNFVTADKQVWDPQWSLLFYAYFSQVNHHPWLPWGFCTFTSPPQ